MCKVFPKIRFLCNVIFVNNSKFKCFVKRKIGGFGYFQELISFGIVLKAKT